MSNPVVHFEIGADDPEKLVEFYKEALGWQIDKWGDSPYWMTYTTKSKKEGENREPGVINGGILPRYEQNQTINTIQVENIDEMMDKIIKHGGKIVKPKAAMEGYMWWSYMADPQGNVFGLMQEDANAK